jgi:hypothetical protein
VSFFTARAPSSYSTPLPLVFAIGSEWRVGVADSPFAEIEL